MLCRIGLGLLATTSVLFSQLESNSITVTASRSVYLQPDQVEFSISIAAPADATLADIIAALQGSGITETNLSGSSVAPWFWYFTLSAPLARIKDTIASLTMLQQKIAQKDPQLRMTFGPDAAQISPQLRDSQACPIADLVSDAQSRAQQMAVAAGLTVGPIVAIAQTPSAGLYVPTIAQRVGDFSFATIGLGSPGVTTITPTLPALTCSVTVKFTLLRYQ